MKHSEMNIRLNQEVMALWHHLHSSINPDFPIIGGQLGWCGVIRAHPYPYDLETTY